MVSGQWSVVRKWRVQSAECRVRKKNEEDSKSETLPSPLSSLPSHGFASHTAKALAPVLAAGPFVERKPFDFAAEVAAREGDLRHHRGRPRRPHALGNRRPALAHGRSRRPDRQPVPLGRPHPGRGRRPHPAAVRPVCRDRLERPQRGRDSRGEEVGRLVLPRHHRRGVAAEDEVPHGPEHLPAGRVGREAAT